jgi:hypothetical protein
VCACEIEPRCGGSINLDGLQPDRAEQPELPLGSDHSCAAVTPCAEDGLPPTFGDPVHYFVAAPPTPVGIGVGCALREQHPSP